MKRTKIYLASILSFASLFFLTSTASAQFQIGNYSITGSGEVAGLPMHKDGKNTSFETYRDVPESVIVPEIQLMIGGKKEDFYLNFDSTKLGLTDQNYILRFGRYGLLDVEFDWNQIPHLFSSNTARTPYTMHNGTYTLGNKPAGTAGALVQTWVNTNANPLDLSLLNEIGKIRVRYTPTPGWTFTGSYWSQSTDGRRALGAYFGPSPGSFNITELMEPLDYQTHNIELGGEYAGNGWSLGLRYNGSIFHNNVSTLVWDNPINLSGVGSACVDSAVYNGAAGTGPCRGRLDLYPSNQAHTWTLTGATKLPLESHFMGTVSYGMRLQNDSFLPFTINSAIVEPRISASSLDGDVRPLMINATVVNRYFDHLNLKAYYRLYDLENRSNKVYFADGIIANDQGNCVPGGTCGEAQTRSFPYAYSRQNLGLDASYDITRWLTGKLGYGWERMHRNRGEVLNADEHSIGPTFDIKPNSWLLFRASYKRSWRSAPDYDAARHMIVDTTADYDDVRTDKLGDLRKFEEAARNRHKISLFGQVSPLETLSFYGGFDFYTDDYARTVIGLNETFDYVPSVGVNYMPLDWLSFFGDYNWERSDYKMTAIERSPGTAAACGLAANTDVNPITCPRAMWTSRGRDGVHTFSIGSDTKLIKDVLNFRIQYSYSPATTKIRASGDSIGTPATDFPEVTSSWQQLLARFEYQIHKNIALKLGYYFNRFDSRDFGVDIMRPWMGNVDTNANVTRSIFLGDRVKSPFIAHVGFIAMKFSF